MQKQILDQLYSICMGIEKMHPFLRDSEFWVSINVDIECTVKQCATCLKYQKTQPQERALHYKIPCRPCEVVSADVFMINGKTILCIVDHHSKFPKVKKVNSLSADDLMQMAKLICATYGLPKKIISDLGTTSQLKHSKQISLSL